MKAILLFSAEIGSPRNQRLLAMLDAATQGDEARVLGHLLRWYLHWAGQPQLDSGVWLHASLNEIGSWARVGADGLKWGKALLETGYVGLITKLYPEPLRTLHDGYVALDPDGDAMLNHSWRYHRLSRKASQIVAFMTDQQKRHRWAATHPKEADGLVSRLQVPPGWFDPPADIQNVTCRTPRGASATEPGEHLPRFATPTSRPHHRHAVAGFAMQGTKHSAPPPSEEMMLTVRKYRHTDPLKAMMALDSHPRAMACWKTAIQKDVQSVKEAVASLVETDHYWRSLNNPAAVLMTGLRQRGLLLD